MKIGIFSDLHFCSAEDLGLGRRPQEGFERLRRALNDFKQGEVDLCVCLGDMIDRAEGDSRDEVLGYLKKCVALIREFGIPFYLVPGNHDFLVLSREDFKGAGITLAPFTIKGEGVTLIGLDANYRENGHFDTIGEKWDDAHLPSTQLKMLEGEIDASCGECVVMIHENLDPCVDFSHQLRNASEVNEIVSRHSDKVKSVLQGHFHYGADNTFSGVPYHTVKSICVFDEGFFEILEF